MLNRVKNWWFKRTYIRHQDGGPQADQEIIDSLNPFDDLIEHEEYPMARTLRTGLIDKVKDTFNVLVGNHYDLGGTGKRRVGLLDILIFFPLFARGMIELVRYGASKYPRIGIITMPLWGSAIFLFEAARFAIGGLLAAALTPIVSVVHLFSYFKAKQFKDSIRKLNLPSSGVNKSKVVFGGSELDSTYKWSLEVGQQGRHEIVLLEQDSETIQALLSTNTHGILSALESESNGGLKEFREIYNEPHNVRSAMDDSADLLPNLLNIVGTYAGIDFESSSLSKRVV